jgi:hypothetical protein
VGTDRRTRRSRMPLAVYTLLCRSLPPVRPTRQIRDAVPVRCGGAGGWPQAASPIMKPSRPRLLAPWDRAPSPAAPSSIPARRKRCSYAAAGAAREGEKCGVFMTWGAVGWRPLTAARWQRRAAAAEMLKRLRLEDAPVCGARCCCSNGLIPTRACHACLIDGTTRRCLCRLLQPASTHSHSLSLSSRAGRCGAAEALEGPALCEMRSAAVCTCQ